MSRPHIVADRYKNTRCAQGHLFQAKQHSHDGPNLLGLSYIGAVETTGITDPDMVEFVIFEGLKYDIKQANKTAQDRNSYRFWPGTGHRAPKAAGSYPLGGLSRRNWQTEYSP